ncbi:splicing factor 3B subunit 1-like [Dorcoceras hygrometricum]|uniref:Splicing factor 3B subunit 1-like n=1 Tax=Dorcoceras hygrometricum TaxID=472368 RepID=A0A2Z7BD34_9LAMI|nr:splicing factor 3B subunit 1-like [Dorcoceras hygrometricum]
MESSLIANALQVNFDSVLGIPDNEGMVMMFRALVSTGLSGFLGCLSVLYEQELEQFFDTASVKDNEIICAVQGKFFGLVYDARSIFSKYGEPVQTSCKKRKMKNEFRLLNDILAKSVTFKAGSFDAVTHERFLLMTVIYFGLKINWSKILFDILKGMVTKTSNQAKGFAAQICALLKSAPNLTMGEAKTCPPLKILTAKTVGTYIAKQKGIDDSHEEDEPVLKKKVVSKKRPAIPSVETAVKKKRTTVAVDRQSGPQPESRHLRQPALEGLMNSAQTKTPRQIDRNKSDHGKRRRHTAAQGGGDHGRKLLVKLIGTSPITARGGGTRRRRREALEEGAAANLGLGFVGVELCHTTLGSRLSIGRAAPAAMDLALVTVAQEAVPIQMISSVTPPAPKRKAPKRKLALAVGSNDEIVETEPDVENVVEQEREKKTADDVDKIIDLVISETEQMEIDMESDDTVVEVTERSTAVNDEDDNLDGAENEIARKMTSFTAPKQFLKEPLRSGEDDDMSGLKQQSKIIVMEKENESENNKEIEPVATDDLGLGKSVAMMTESEDTEPLSKVLVLTDKSKTNEESMSIEDILKQIPTDMMFPYMTAAEVTRIKFGLSIEISEVNEGDWYKASLPRIVASDKGKVPLVAKDEIKGHPTQEMFSLICADIDFLVQLREKVIEDCNIPKFGLRRNECLTRGKTLC